MNQKIKIKKIYTRMLKIYKNSVKDIVIVINCCWHLNNLVIVLLLLANIFILYKNYFSDLLLFNNSNTTRILLPIWLYVAIISVICMLGGLKSHAGV